MAQTHMSLLEMIIQEGRQGQCGFLPGSLPHTGGAGPNYGDHWSKGLACGWGWHMCLPQPYWFLQILEAGACE